MLNNAINPKLKSISTIKYYVIIIVIDKKIMKVTCDYKVNVNI